MEVRILYINKDSYTMRLLDSAGDLDVPDESLTYTANVAQSVGRSSEENRFRNLKSILIKRRQWKTSRPNLTPTNWKN